MRKLLIGAVAALGLVSPAFAADQPMGPVFKAPIMAPPLLSWTGIYFGVGVGGRWTDPEWTTTCLAPDALGTATCPNDIFLGTTRIGNDNPGKFDSLGFRVSGYVGYNWQIANWLIGVEGDFGWGDNKETRTGIPGTWSATFGPGTDVATVEDTWDASARARLGMLITPTWLVYVTGGVAWIHKEATASCPATFPVGWCAVAITQTADKTHTGWTVGAGFEWMFMPNWIARAEYRYSDFDSWSQTFFSATPIDSFTFTIDQKVHMAYFGIAFKFGP